MLIDIALISIWTMSSDRVSRVMLEEDILFIKVRIVEVKGNSRSRSPHHTPGWKSWFQAVFLWTKAGLLDAAYVVYFSSR
jgi:hypothetical protein